MNAICEEIRKGRIVVLVHEDGVDLVMAAQHVSAGSINFMATHARGLVCLALTSQHCARLGLRPMVVGTAASQRAAFTVSIEARHGVSTGISAADRAHTIAVAVSSGAAPADLVQPGHVFPIQAVDGGVLVRAGGAEAACDLARLAGLDAAAVICRVLNDDGTAAGMADANRLAARHGLAVASVQDVVAYRAEHEGMVTRLTDRTVDTPQGRFECAAFVDRAGGVHMALHKGCRPGCGEVLVHLRGSFSALDMLGIGTDSNGWTLPAALDALQRSSAAVAVLMHTCGQSESFADRLAAAGPCRPVPRDAAAQAVIAQILRALRADRIRHLGAPAAPPAGFETRPWTAALVQA